MSLKIPLLCSLIITLITWKLYFLMIMIIFPFLLSIVWLISFKFCSVIQAITSLKNSLSYPQCPQWMQDKLAIIPDTSQLIWGKLRRVSKMLMRSVIMTKQKHWGCVIPMMNVPIFKIKRTTTNCPTCEDGEGEENDRHIRIAGVSAFKGQLLA